MAIKVTLLTHTPNPEQTVAMAAKLCLKPICGPMMPPPMPCSMDCSDSSDDPGPVMPDPCQIIPIPSSMLNAESLSSASGSPIIGTITQGNTIIFDSTVKSLSLTNFATSIAAKVNPQGQFNIPGFYDVVVTYTFTYYLQLLDSSGNVLAVTVTGGPSDLPVLTFKEFLHEVNHTLMNDFVSMPND